MSLTVGAFYKAGQERLKLEVLGGADYFDSEVKEKAINRPGLALAGFFNHFAKDRLQVMGLAELTYLESLTPSEQHFRLEQLFHQRIPALVVCRNREVGETLCRVAEKYRTPLFRSALVTSEFVNAATLVIENLTMPQLSFQGTMVSVMDVGMILRGEPGIGKSETALALILRGHSLVADDLTMLSLESSGRIFGTARDSTRYHMEVRGLGIVHIPSLFGVKSMRLEAPLDLVVNLQRTPITDEDRTGLQGRYVEILGERVPSIDLMAAPGRDMAHLIEVAALNHRLKTMGHDAAKEFDEKIMDNLWQKRNL